MNLKLAVFVMMGGAVGSLLRFCLQVAGNAPGSFLPWGTTTANLLGSLAVGVLIPFVQFIPESYRHLIMVGFLGGFTTMSSFASESVTLATEAEWSRFVMYWLVSAVGCIAAAAIGMWLGLWLEKRLI